MLIRGEFNHRLGWDSMISTDHSSACGIPDDAYHQTKAAIHPYFLKYAGLDRKLKLFHSLELEKAS